MTAGDWVGTVLIATAPLVMVAQWWVFSELAAIAAAREAMEYQFVIYNNPKDHPGSYVVRRWALTNPPTPDRDCWLFPSLEDARRIIPASAVLFPRHPDDDPCIVEVWW